VWFGFEIAVGVAPVSLSDPILGLVSPFPLYLFVGRFSKWLM
jgi:hypothetical protein